MNRIEEKFKELKKDKKKALIVFLTCGYPNLKTTEKLVYYLEKWGVDIVELGVPFSDPIADGPTIQYSSLFSLNQGTNLKKIFQLVARIRKKSNLPLVLMSYYNPIYQYKNFFRIAKKNGLDGIIIPDLLPEEGRKLQAKNPTSGRINSKQRAGLDLIYLLAPTSNEERIKMITQQSQGFVYVVSLTGVTGVRNRLPAGLKSFLKKVRSFTNKPLALGFGISEAKQVEEVKSLVDGIIVGSAIIEIIRKYKNPLLELKKFIFSIKNVLSN